MKSKVLSDLEPVIERLHQTNMSLPWGDLAFYKSWLAQSYYFVRHSTRLLAIASSQARFDQPQLHVRMAQHISEEAFHEKLAERDLSQLGFKISDIEEKAITKAFYRNQYYGIENSGSCYLLGYILFLEWMAVRSGPQVCERLSEGVDIKAQSFLRVHAEEDKDHVEKAIQQISGLRGADLEMALESFSVSSELYEKMLQEIMAECMDRNASGLPKAG